MLLAKREKNEGSSAEGPKEGKNNSRSNATGIEVRSHVVHAPGNCKICAPCDQGNAFFLSSYQEIPS